MLAALLERAGMEDAGREIVFEGADYGTPAEPPMLSGLIAVALPIASRKISKVVGCGEKDIKSGRQTDASSRQIHD
jgi:hypothetical protein